MSGIGVALQSRLAPFIINNADLPTDVQPRFVRVLSVPEYYAEYRETGNGYAAFLGSSIAAKVSCSSIIIQAYPILINIQCLDYFQRSKWQELCVKGRLHEQRPTFNH